MSRAGGGARGPARRRAEGPPRPVIACHRGTCRRIPGRLVAATFAQREAAAAGGDVRRWCALGGARRRGWRGSCPACGSGLLRDGAGGNLSIHAGTPGDAAGLGIAGHIFCAEKGPCHDVPEDLPRAEGRDPKPAAMVGDA
ncbi:hypothetical protein BCF33_2648 [Hasllibacter halocynthiae]|uniref:Uncharacterized protein n=1 Tax=Hasllibacter halocynthiae TaxID=595589 RepID=A0A2T0X4H6_9RHOB|nr:GFA family protein [Hasllibacter halocynthiae]PRY93764.1 hypothetical protein BCF33_2648 [Hasllibacter halocynthiae]